MSVEYDEPVATIPHLSHLSLIILSPHEQTTLPTVQQTLERAATLSKVGANRPHELVLVKPPGEHTPHYTAEDERQTLQDGASASARPTKVLTAPEDTHGYDAAILSALQAAAGDYIIVLDQQALEKLPSAETLASMLLAAQEADIVIASRYLPGADESSVTNSQGVMRELRTWLVRTTDTFAVSALLPRLRHCTDLGSNLYLVHRRVIEALPIASGKSAATSLSFLLEILAQGQWTNLIETPYRSATLPEVTSAQRMTPLSTLRALRRGKLSKGAVNYRYQHLPPGEYDPEPLDSELPDIEAVTGKRRRRLIWTVALLAVALRLILLPIGHWWDLTVDYNTFIDLANNHSPYDTMVYLSHIAWASKWDYNYEYYAYPPVPLYIYYPLAHIYAFFHPTAAYYIPVSGTYAMPDLSFDFFFLLKLPIWIADFLIAALLARMSGTVRGFRDYLLNPYVLLVSGAWTFDAIMVLGLVLAVYYLQRGKLVASGSALAFGTMVKFIPAIALPTMILYLVKKKRPLHEIILFVGAYGVSCLVMIGPFLNGLLYVVNFHDNRVGGGMNWEMFWRLGTFFPPHTVLDPLSMAIGAFGTPTLIIVLLLAWWYCFTARQMSLNRMIIVTLLAFLIGSKLVNEQYALILLPFVFIEAWRVGGAWRWLARLFWIVPLLYAIVRVPIDRFAWLLDRSVWGAAAKAIAATGKSGLGGQFMPWSNPPEQQLIILVLSIGFTVLCLVGFFWPVRRMIRPIRHLQALETQPEIRQRSEEAPTHLLGRDTTQPEPAVALQ